MASVPSATAQPARAPDEEQPVDADGTESAPEPASEDGSTDLSEVPASAGAPASTPASGGVATGNSTTCAAASCRNAASVAERYSGGRPAGGSRHRSAVQTHGRSEMAASGGG